MSDELEGKIGYSINFPIDLYKYLKVRAKSNNRSIAKELITIIENEMRKDVLAI